MKKTVKKSRKWEWRGGVGLIEEPKIVKQKKKTNIKGILTQAYCTKENEHIK